MKTIAHIVSTSEYSGAEKIVIEICNGLNKDYNFIYICRQGGLERYLKKNNIKYILYKNIKELVYLLKNEKIDIVHAHDYTASLLAGFFFKGRIISHIHNNTTFAKTLNLKSLAYFLSTKNIENILCVSNSIIDEMYFKNKLENKLKVTYNWVNVGERYWSEDVEKDIDILFVGRFTEQKNPMLFLECINEIKRTSFENIRVKMVGRGELKPDIINYINENNLKSNIEVVDFTDEPHKYMKEAKIFFVPSKWEGFGIVFLEAMLNECAIVTTPVGGINEIFKDNLSNLSLDKDRLIEINKKLLQDEEYRKETILKNEDILIKFDMKTNIKKIERYYE